MKGVVFMIISDYVAIVAIIVSIIGIFIGYKNHKSNQLLTVNQEVMRQKENKYQTLLNKNHSRVSLIPYFHLELEKEIYVKKQTDRNLCILPITLINLGKESATNIRLIPILDNGGLEDYFKTSGESNYEHFIHDYLDKQYAFPQGRVNLSAHCNEHECAYDVYFKIQFNDLVGRTYVQKFRFQYCTTIMNNFSLNHSTSVPICIKDEDKTENEKARYN